ncbi:hypothetical protein [Salibacterium aidingense]|uniref:hypothetical protein n=1 Tax=Salibacterium aidingense TaxID=384933 RepID=UPI00047BA6D0|nr:hypothetical protein [Salibacterium aidingense]
MESTYDKIEWVVNCIVNRHMTTSPFELAQKEGVLVYHQSLPLPVNGFAMTIYNQRFIIMNDTHSLQDDFMTCSRGLAHHIVGDDKFDLHIVSHSAEGYPLEANIEYFAKVLTAKQTKNQNSEHLLNHYSLKELTEAVSLA